MGCRFEKRLTETEGSPRGRERDRGHREGLADDRISSIPDPLLLALQLSWPMFLGPLTEAPDVGARWLSMGMACRAPRLHVFLGGVGLLDSGHCQPMSLPGLPFLVLEPSLSLILPPQSLPLGMRPKSTAAPPFNSTQGHGYRGL